MRYAVIIILLIRLITQTEGQTVYHIDPQYPVHKLDPYTLVLHDSTGEMNHELFLETPDSALRLASSFPKGLEYVADNWVRFKLTSDTTLKDWILNWEERYFNSGGWHRGNGFVDVYGFIKGEHVFHKKTGSIVPRREREIKPWNNISRIKIDLQPRDTLLIVAKVNGNSLGYPPQLNITLRQPEFQNYFPVFNFHQLIKLVFLGMLLLGFIYYALLFIYIKRRVYLLFSIWLFLTLITMSMSVEIDLMTELFLFNAPQLRLLFWSLTSSLVWIVFWYFGREFAQIPKKYKILDKVIVGLTIALFLEALYYIYNIQSSEIADRMNTAASHFKIYGSFIMIGFVISVILALKKDPLARYFGVGAIFATAAPILGSLWVNGIVRLPFDPFVWGIFLQIVTYSFGLAFRRKQIDQKFQQAQLQLIEAERSKLEMFRMKELDKIKTRFFANISHEFRTPLSLILGPIQRAKNKNPDNAEITLSDQSVSIINRNGERLQQLVDQLLELSQAESGEITLDLSYGSILEEIKQSCESFVDSAEKKKLNYSVNIQGEILNGYYDKDKLQKILYNLISNAIKYTPTGGRVEVSAKPLKDAFEIEITDSGRGMNREEMAQVFDRFYRVEGSEEKGSGIGLALTKELVDIYKGTIHVDSTPGKGSRFTVNLPCSLDVFGSGVVDNVTQNDSGEIKVVDKKPSTLKIPESESFDKDRPTILVVEDHEDLRNYIGEILATDYEVIFAADGDQGFSKAIETIPNLIVSDIMMPGRDGIELCRDLKTDIRTSHIPIILLTAKAGQENKLQGLEHGADGYITKPFDEKELLLRAQNLMKLQENLWTRFSSGESSLKANTKGETIDDAFMIKVYEVIEEYYTDETFSVERLASEINFSRSQLHRKVKALTNKSASHLIRETRLQKAMQLIQRRDQTISEIAYAVGYNNLSYFSKSFKDYFGRLPSEV